MHLDVAAAVVALVAYGFSVYVTGPGVLDDRVRVLILPATTVVGALFLLLGCTLLLYRYVKHRRDVIQDEPLTADERKRAEELLRG